MVLRKARHFEVPLYGKVTTLKLKNAGKMEEVFFFSVGRWGFQFGKIDGNSPAEEMIILHHITRCGWEMVGSTVYMIIYIIYMNVLWYLYVTR